MKIKRDNFQNVTNFKGDTFTASLNMERLELVVEDLVKNYVNPEFAVLREWVSNAYDSHVDAGTDAAIEVTLPTELEPTLTVRDFGVGMSYDEVKNLYAVFGSTTKDESNEVIGGKGIGGKSALALASQYTLTTVKDGIKNIFIFERSPSGGVQAKTIMMNSETDEPNGVTAIVSVDRPNVFANEINVNNVLLGWPSDSINITNNDFTFKSIDSMSEKLTNGYIANGAFETPELVRGTYSNHYQVKGELFSSKDRQAFTALVGPVVYNFEFETSEFMGVYSRSGLPELSKMIALQVDIGSVTFPSSREVIEKTRSNRAHMTEILDNLIKEARDLLIDKIQKAETHHDAFRLVNSNLAMVLNRHGLFYPSDYTYKGKSIPEVYELNKTDAGYGFKIIGNAYRNNQRFQITGTGELGQIQLTDVRFLIISEGEASPQTLRNLFRKYVIAKELKFKDLTGNLIISSNPDPWVKGAASHVIYEKDLRTIAAEVKTSTVKRNTVNERINSYLVEVYKIQDTALRYDTYSVEEFMNLETYDESKKIAFMSYDESVNIHTEFLEISKFYPEVFNDYYVINFQTRAKSETIAKIVKNPMLKFENFIQEVFAKYVKTNPFTAQAQLAQSIPFLFREHDITGPLGQEIIGSSDVHEEFKNIVQKNIEYYTFRQNNHYNRWSPKSTLKSLIEQKFKKENVSPNVVIHEEFEVLEMQTFPYDFKMTPSYAKFLNFLTENYITAITAKVKEKELILEAA